MSYVCAFMYGCVCRSQYIYIYITHSSICTYFNIYVLIDAHTY